MVPKNGTNVIISQEYRRIDTSELSYTEVLSTLWLMIRRVYLHFAALPRLDMMASTTPFAFSDDKWRTETGPTHPFGRQNGTVMLKISSIGDFPFQLAIIRIYSVICSFTCDRLQTQV